MAVSIHIESLARKFTLYECLGIWKWSSQIYVNITKNQILGS